MHVERQHTDWQNWVKTGLFSKSVFFSKVSLYTLALAFFNGWFNPISYRVRELLKTVDLVKGKTSKELEEIPLDERTWHTEDAKAVAYYLASMPTVNALLIFSLVWPFVYGAYIGVTEILVWGIEGLLSWVEQLGLADFYMLQVWLIQTN